MTGHERSDQNVTGQAGASIVRTVLRQLRLLIVAGIATGAIVVGIGSRLAMLLLRLTSPDSVIGMQSDDDFTIGRFTLSGTYNLLALGAAVGILGVAVYQCVAPRLIGPVWFRRLTVGLACGAVVGSMLIDGGGIDFTVLQPTWLAVGLFVALPAVFGVAVAAVVDRLGDPARPTPTGWRVWAVPLAIVACFPFTIVLLIPGVAIVTIWVLVRDRTGLVRWTSGRRATLIVQAAWLAVAVLGLVALIGDVNGLA